MTCRNINQYEVQILAGDAHQDRNIPPQPINIAAIPDIPYDYQITENRKQ